MIIQGRGDNALMFTILVLLKTIECVKVVSRVNDEFNWHSALQDTRHVEPVIEGGSRSGKIEQLR